MNTSKYSGVYLSSKLYLHLMNPEKYECIIIEFLHLNPTDITFVAIVSDGYSGEIVVRTEVNKRQVVEIWNLRIPDS